MAFVLSKYLQNRGGRTHRKKEIERGESISLDTTLDEVSHSVWYRFGIGEHTLLITDSDFDRMVKHVADVKLLRSARKNS